MKIFNILTSMLVFTVVSNLSAATTENNEFGAEELKATNVVSTVQTPSHPLDYYKYSGDTWPKTPEAGNMRLWKPVWDTKESMLDAFSRGRDNLYEAFSWNNEKPVTIKDRSLDILAASARFTLVPAALAILFPITYYNADEKGEWNITIIDNSNAPIQENSFFQNLVKALFAPIIATAAVADRVSTKK